MDTGTVLEIIEMLDKRIEEKHEDPLAQVSEYFELTLFRDYLQKHIDSLQNQVENEMNRGE